MAFPLTRQDSFEQMACGECGIEFWVPAHFYRERIENGKGWHCPNGHGRVFREREVDRLKRQLEVQTREATMQAERAKREAERANNAEKKLASVKKRVANGVCPECHRHFINVERHMKTKHAKGTIHGK